MSERLRWKRALSRGSAGGGSHFTRNKAPNEKGLGLAWNRLKSSVRAKESQDSREDQADHSIAKRSHHTRFQRKMAEVR